MLRLIDANFNRASEGLRLLEDVARFLLDDAGLSEQLKSLRHSILGGDLTFQRKLLLARDSVQDVGAFAPVPDELKREDLPAIVIANARRAQESLRVLEEFAKLPGQSLDSAIFKKARFDIYEIERKLTAALIRQDKRNKISGVYLVLDYDALAGRDEAEVAGQALSGGVKMIQLRDKNRERREVLATAMKLRDSETSEIQVIQAMQTTPHLPILATISCPSCSCWLHSFCFVGPQPPTI
jgi:thiamine-phosphate pyrophosphorylase